MAPRSIATINQRPTLLPSPFCERLGPLLLEAILARDFYVVVGAVMLSAVVLVGGMLVADVLLFLADPHIRVEGLA